MKGRQSVESKLIADLAALGPAVRDSALAGAALGVARALDAGPGDRSRVMLTRELRLAVEALHRLAPEGGDSELARFLDEVTAAEYSDAAH